MRTLYIALFMVLCSSKLFGQISFQFVPDIYGRNIDGLFNCRVTNPSSQHLSAVLTITVSERAAGTICIIKTQPFNVYPGTNPIPVSAARSAAIQFGGNKLAQMTSSNHLFPEGDYSYCFSMTFVHSDNLPEEQCFEYTLAPFADMSLIDPYNQDQLCDKRPVFTWQPLLPAIPGALYQLVLAEIKPGQNATEAINYNMPVINQSSIFSPMLPYPSIAPDLKNKQKYAWQVTAYKDQTVLNRSDIWEFTLDCRDSIKKKDSVNNYRLIEDLAQGNFYLADGSIRFAVVNSYAPQKLRYSIFSLKNQHKKIKGLPSINLKNGRNAIVIDLTNNKAFIDKEYYIMEVMLPDGSKKSLRMLFEKPND